MMNMSMRFRERSRALQRGGFCDKEGWVIRDEDEYVDVEEVEEDVASPSFAEQARAGRLWMRKAGIRVRNEISFPLEMASILHSEISCIGLQLETSAIRPMGSKSFLHDLPPRRKGRCYHQCLTFYKIILFRMTPSMEGQTLPQKVPALDNMSRVEPPSSFPKVR